MSSNAYSADSPYYLIYGCVLQGLLKLLHFYCGAYYWLNIWVSLKFLCWSPKPNMMAMESLGAN